MVCQAATKVVGKASIHPTNITITVRLKGSSMNNVITQSTHHVVDDIQQNKRVHAFCQDALSDHDAVNLAHLLASKQLSPQEVQQAVIARAKRVNPMLHAIELDCFEQPITSRKGKKGIFANVPFFIKDNTDIKGMPTNHGSDAVHGHASKKHGIVTEQMLAQGFVLMGKSRLPEFGLSASSEYKAQPPVRNPWHLDYSCGASSGGSAALVAAGVIPVAHANDGGGSIRIPAACCGLVGLKPSRGRFKDGEIARTLPINIISEGIVSRSVRDTAQFFAGMEASYYNKKLAPIGMVQGAGKKRLRVGLLLDSLQTSTDQETRNTVLETATLLENLGHDIVETKLPIDSRFVKDFTLYWGFLAFMACTMGKRSLSPNFDVSQVDHLTRGLADLYKKNFYHTPFMLYRLKKVNQQYLQFFNECDVVLSPTLAHTTPELGFLSPQQDFEQLMDRLQNYAAFTPIQNVSGAPAISLPMGQTSLGLPIGVQLSSRLGDEKTLLELAFALEEAKPWQKIYSEL